MNEKTLLALALAKSLNSNAFPAAGTEVTTTLTAAEVSGAASSGTTAQPLVRFTPGAGYHGNAYDTTITIGITLPQTVS